MFSESALLLSSLRHCIAHKQFVQQVTVVVSHLSSIVFGLPAVYADHSTFRWRLQGNRQVTRAAVEFYGPDRAKFLGKHTHIVSANALPFVKLSCCPA